MKNPCRGVYKWGEKRKWKSWSKTGLPKPLITSGNILKQDADHHMFCVDTSFKAENHK